MSKFLEALVRSEGKSCAGKIKFPREDSAVRCAVEMTTKRQAQGKDEVFEHYKCAHCDGWHMGHRTSFDWIPESHNAYTLVIIQRLCTDKCNGKDGFFFTNTVISNRIMEHFPGIKELPELVSVCPVCKSRTSQEGRRIFIPLSEIPQDSTETIESLWDRYQKKL